MHKVGDLLWDGDNNEFGVIIKIHEPQTEKPEDEFIYAVRFMNTDEVDCFRERGIHRYKKDLRLKLEGFE